MLDIGNLIWVIPGVVGLWVHNYTLAVKLPQLEGWAYLFAIVLFAFPYYLVSSLEPMPILASLGNWSTLLYSTLISGSLGWFAAAIRNKWSPRSDPFHENCTLWLEKPVFITLKSKRIYLGILLDHTRDIRFEYTIKIIPLFSGYRDECGRVVWDFEYPLEKGAFVEMIIPGRQITTFALWSGSDKFENKPI